MYEHAIVGKQGNGEEKKNLQFGVEKESRACKVEENRVKGQGGHLGDKAKRTEPVTCNPMCHTVMVK